MNHSILTVGMMHKKEPEDIDGHDEPENETNNCRKRAADSSTPQTRSRKLYKSADSSNSSYNSKATFTSRNISTGEAALEGLPTRHPSHHDNRSHPGAFHVGGVGSSADVSALTTSYFDNTDNASTSSYSIFVIPQASLVREDGDDDSDDDEEDESDNTPTLPSLIEVIRASALFDPENNNNTPKPAVERDLEASTLAESTSSSSRTATSSDDDENTKTGSIVVVLHRRWVYCFTLLLCLLVLGVTAMGIRMALASQVRKSKELHRQHRHPPPPPPFLKKSTTITCFDRNGDGNCDRNKTTKNKKGDASGDFGNSNNENNYRPDNYNNLRRRVLSVDTS